MIESVMAGSLNALLSIMVYTAVFMLKNTKIFSNFAMCLR